MAEHNVTVARAFTKLMGTFVTFLDNDAGSKTHLLAIFRADRAGPNHVEVPRRKRRVVPAPDVAEDGGLKFRHDVQGGDLPARRLEGPAHRLGAAEKLQESRRF